jgi:hypothetical protein
MGYASVWMEQERRFECPQHGAQFERDGGYRAGPAPRPMDLYHAAFNSRGDLVVDTSRRVMREEASPDQALPPMALCPGCAGRRRA